MDIEIRHTSTIIYARLPDGSKAYIKYTVENGRMRIISTYTPPKYRGMGIASKLMDYAVRLARNKGLLIEPICSYSIHYVLKHPEHRDLLVPELRSADLEKLLKERLEHERREHSFSSL